MDLFFSKTMTRRWWILLLALYVVYLPHTLQCCSDWLIMNATNRIFLQSPSHFFLRLCSSQTQTGLFLRWILNIFHATDLSTSFSGMSGLPMKTDWHRQTVWLKHFLESSFILDNTNKQSLEILWTVIYILHIFYTGFMLEHNKALLYGNHADEWREGTNVNHWAPHTVELFTKEATKSNSYYIFT